MEVFPIVPADVRVGWAYALMAVLLLVFVAVGWLLFSSLRAASSATFTVSPSGLVLQGDIYGRTVPFSKLRLNEARAVDLLSDRDLGLKWRVGGTSIPGYNSGWFKLNSGEKALVYITDRSRVAYLPTTDGYAVMVSVEDPSWLITSLKKHSGAPPAQ